MAPCSCAGSSKFVHLKCVQLWLTKTINPRTVGRATVITWKPLICELCHKNLPFKVYLDGKRYFTVNIPKPRKPYLVLNPIFREKDTGKAKIYYLVSFAEHREMIIGRKTDSDIIFSDDSTEFIQTVWASTRITGPAKSPAIPKAEIPPRPPKNASSIGSLVEW